MTERAVFSLFVRRLPRNRNFLVACGLDTVLDYLESLRFTQQDLDYLHTLKIFSDRFLTWLSEFRFTGDVHAVREGTPVFANEPILEVEAPLPEAQLIETFLLNQIQLQTMLASKAHRVVTAAKGCSVIDFRRAPDARHRRCSQRRPRLLDRGRECHLQRPRRKAFRHSRRGHTRPQLHPGPRRRVRRLPRLRRPLSRHCPLDRHLRHARRRGEGHRVWRKNWEKTSR